VSHDASITAVGAQMGSYCAAASPLIAPLHMPRDLLADLVDETPFEQSFQRRDHCVHGSAAAGFASFSQARFGGRTRG
jgi:hypothetical protein